MSDFYQRASQLSPDIYRRFKTALERGKWPDGRPVLQQQKAILLEAVILYEDKNIAAGQRLGDMEDRCASDPAPEEGPLKWK